MITTKGFTSINNIEGYKPFQICYDELDANTIQLDVYGIGAINYFEPFSKDLEVLINADINKALKDYSENTTHDASEIGYTLNFQPKKKIDQDYKTQVVEINMSIIFKKPVLGVAASQLQLTIELITSMIIGEIFILHGTC
ncbi:hypothetical protein OX284_004880 [Flavobacterium sp. SUN046]|uniref:hypothetical protein n=1 Tax=Flavobacterium sp. SUN046 TaxID=3002440 RepID=UPI002DB7B8B7|nr:hypothetical protein [Flavobacterium sp. SUN046]MEC4048755.1 hypothetical protein [Flavobacterium sp. SUN046]